MTVDLFGVDRKGARLSECGRYRYHLWRGWGDPDHGLPMTFVMLNPSTADADVDDPTIRRCVGFAKREGCVALNVGNLFAWRSPHPAQLRHVDDPVGPDNHNLLECLLDIHSVFNTPLVVAWGATGPRTLVDREADRLVARANARGVPLWCLGHTENGAPRHPLYVRSAEPLVRYRGSTA